MRRVEWLVGLGALIAAGGSVALVGTIGALSGCSTDFNDCSKYAHAGCPGFADASNPDGNVVNPPPAPECNGEPSAPMDSMTERVGNIRDTCAVFVRADSTADMPDGTMKFPYKTLADAMAATSSSKVKVFACKSAAFSEAVTVAAAIELYGGFDCTADQWTWTATDRTELDGPADSAALTISMTGDNAKISNWTIKGHAPVTGTSSVAVAVDELPTGVTIQQSDIMAESGVKGADGVTPTDAVTSGQDAPAPNSATMDACMNQNSAAGGTPGSTMCEGVDTSGGAGGQGGVVGGPKDTPNGDGLKGADGAPAPNPNPTQSGVGGGGQVDLAMQCAGGNKGADGTVGATGAAAAGPIKLSLSGLTGGKGGNGGTGTPGQGGGGGGGGKWGSFCSGSSVGNGASGGGGGAGGCGGKGGGGGLPGGSSIAILSLGTNLTIDTSSVTLTTKDAGNGGNGATGGTGGSLGSGAKGGTHFGSSIDGCKGGDGGNGGKGGPGSGGLGGFSAGIAFAKVPVSTFTFRTPPVIGIKGTGGTGGNNGADGAAGVVCDFSSMTPTCM